jgi:D-amino-acid dehydrogenase
MRVVVLGAGVIGVTTAWALNSYGHQVTVVERQSAPAKETSFANGGQLSVSHVEPWANPRAPMQILRWLGDEAAPLLWRMRADETQWRWGCRFLYECLPFRTRQNSLSLLNLGLFSREVMNQVRSGLGLTYHQSQLGILHFFTNLHEFAVARAAIERQSLGAKLRVVKTANECLELEPALGSSRQTVVGGTFSAEDESGDAREFTEALAEHCTTRGVSFQFGTTVAELERRDGRIVAVRLNDGRTIDADAFVIALGSYTGPFLNKLNLRFPIYPLKGYSASIALAAGSQAPEVSLTDEAHKLVISRFGDTLRVAGTAEFNGYDTSVNKQRCEAIMARVRALFPHLNDAGEVQYWAGLRPATPGNVPLIGVTPIPNLWINSGHGTLGWTLACGSAHLLAQLMSGERPEIDATPFRAS